ncbi:MAG: hypothetical protein AAGJ95_04965 [Cyanobacteria bacterium J06554_11]
MDSERQILYTPIRKLQQVLPSSTSFVELFFIGNPDYFIFAVRPQRLTSVLIDISRRLSSAKAHQQKPTGWRRALKIHAKMFSFFAKRFMKIAE